MSESRNLIPNPKPLDQGMSYKQVASHENLDGWLRVTGNDTDTGWIMKCWQGIDLDTNGTTGYRNGVRLAAPGDYVAEIGVHTPERLRLQFVLILVSDSGERIGNPISVISDTSGPRTMRADVTAGEPCCVTWLLRASAPTANVREWGLRRMTIVSKPDYERMREQGIIWFDGDSIIRGD